MSWVSDLAGILRGLEKVNRALLCGQRCELRNAWMNSSLRPVAKDVCNQIEEVVSNAMLRQSSSKCCSSKEYEVSDKGHPTAPPAGNDPSSSSQSSGQPDMPPSTTASPGPETVHSKSTAPGTVAPPNSRLFHTLARSSFIANQRRWKTTLAAGDEALAAMASVPKSTSKPNQEASGDQKASDIPPSKSSNEGASKKRNFKQELSSRSRERKVPGTRVERLVSFGSLGAGLAVGALTEAAKRGFGFSETGEKTAILDNSMLLTEANANRIVDTLCKVRGAALKLGQMLSIQDNSMMPPDLQQIFERVRQSADFMPSWQMEKVLEKDLGADWKSKFLSFDSKPFAAASIGQVHKGTLHDGQLVAVKIQYPGVAESINSDINNLMSLLKVWQILPKGLYADKALKVARRELAWECDYIREATCSDKFRSLMKDDPVFYVPEIFWDLTRKRVLTSELVYGETLDKLENADQETRNFICENILRLCLNEVFTYNFMQTDPNWSNFLYDAENKRIMLIDFGASREYSRKFTDVYIQVIKCAALGDRKGVLDGSVTLGFLTGYETKVMMDAHVDAVMILGEAFTHDAPFDFGQQSTAARIHTLMPVMLRHRLTPPPEETYSLHRKMAGCFLLCTKLRAEVECKPIFDAVWEQYHRKPTAAEATAAASATPQATPSH